MFFERGVDVLKTIVFTKISQIDAIFIPFLAKRDYLYRIH